MSTWDLTALLNAADPAVSLPERHLWLVRLLEWLRHGQPAEDAPASASTPTPVLRLRQLCQVLERHPEHRLRVQGLLSAFLREADAVTLLADFGFAPRASFASELMRRLRAKLLPGTPDTRNLAELFHLIFRGSDAGWIARIDAPTLARLAALWPDSPTPWGPTVLTAITVLCSAVRAAGYSAPLRLRMSPPARTAGDERGGAADSRPAGAAVRAAQPTAAPSPVPVAGDPFGQLSIAAEDFRQAFQAGDATAILQSASYLRALLAECRAAADTVLDHLEEYGVSLHIVFDVDQLRLRTERVELLLNHLLAPDHAARETQHLVLDWVETLHATRSVRALVRDQSRQLSRQVAERQAESGEHYITRTRAEYGAMLRAACGGGAVIAGTTLAKFALGALGLTAFWGGFWAGVNYATSFVIVMLLHWTVATKQPAMTAPAMAAKLADLHRGHDSAPAAVEAFVDEVAHLIRSQMAGILGNLAVCFPLVLALQLAAWAAFGAPLIGEHKAQAVLASQPLIGLTPLYAAFTGILLFASALIAGWVENWFVFHRLDSALRWNPALIALFGRSRTARWASWWRLHVSGIAANVSLGMLLGLVPALLQFLGVGLDVRHVTLASGQLAAALGALGVEALRMPAVWWCVAAIPVIGLLNLGVSFVLAFRVALRARNIPFDARADIYRAILSRLKREPLSFLRPPGGLGR